MTLWSRIKLGFKFLLCGFESATDYLLSLLNEFLGKGRNPERIQKAREFITPILGYMRKYQDFCPAIWAKDYQKLIEVIQVLNDTLADNKVTDDEVEKLDKVIADVKAAIEEWMKD